LEIIFHSHHAAVSEHMRKRAARAVERAATRIPRIVEAIVRFEEDGPTRRVTVTLRAPKHHDIMGSAEGRFFGPALTQAVARVLSQANRERSSIGHARSRQTARAKARVGR
jgi:ribosome-associated translation inhibitor RaiA